jgi:hypothetical protein
MENAILERLKNQTKNLKTLSEELRLQMALGKAEARDLIERERKNLNSYINKQKREFDNSDTVNQTNRVSFLTSVENLESVLSDNVPEESVAYDKYKNNVLKNVYKLEEEIKTNYPELSLSMQSKLDNFKNKMDAFRVNLALHDKDDPKKVEKIRNEFTGKLEDIRKILSDREDSQSKIDSFVEDITESFNYLKRAISDLSD